MRATRYSRHRITSPDLLVYTRLMAEDNGAELLRLRHALGHALREEVTRRQRQVLFLYYNENYTMAEIGAQLGVDRTTVSRPEAGGAASPAMPAVRGRGLAPGEFWGGRGRKSPPSH